MNLLESNMLDLILQLSDFDEGDALLKAYMKKRFFDLFVSMTVLMVLSPFIFLIIYLIRRDGGPAFYWQKRVGWDQKEFNFPKFRSMVVNADKMKDDLLKTNQHGQEGVTFKMKDDPRITKVGKFLRRFSIDELPQLWCVLEGSMSLVGPRPPVPREVALYTDEQKMRLMAIPGITGIWQVSGRSDVGFEQQYEMDLEYMRKYSMLTDLKILFKTIPAVLFGKGAY